MIILFSPSESKTQLDGYSSICKESFIFQDQYAKRIEAVKIYNEYINSNSIDSLLDIFGIKDIEKIQEYQKNIFEAATCPAIKRYSGVSYSYLAYDTLNQNAKYYIFNNVIIFSNLFGPVSAGDKIPYYKLKQGAKIGSFTFEQFYRDNFSSALDKYIDNQEIVDLRAGFYEKFYKIKKKYTTFKFIKQGKVVSHFAKAYRGIILKLMAENNILESKDIISHFPESLEVIDTTIKGFKEEFILNILD